MVDVVHDSGTDDYGQRKDNQQQPASTHIQ
jgi:hypothetical protein